MSSDSIKKRKSKVLRNEGGTTEVKRGRGEVEQQVPNQCFSRVLTLLLQSIFIILCYYYNGDHSKVVVL